LTRPHTGGEDLMRDAAALSRRVELRVPGMEDKVIAGFRDDDRLSLYFGEDRYYQFDQGRLRRGAVAGHLFRTQGLTLAELTPQRTAEATALCRRDLSAGQLERFLEELRGYLTVLHRALESDAATVIRQIPETATILPVLRDAIGMILSRPMSLADPINPHR
jgi:hypothetical protein